MMSISKEWSRLTAEQVSIIEKHQSEYPIKLGAIANEFGLVVKKATLAANISGEIKETDGVVLIRVNRHDVKARQRYTLAHEIAHFLLHRDLLGDGITDDILYRSSQSNKVEAEANRLAADIVMPMKHVNELIGEHAKENNLKMERVYEKVAECLDVSVSALKYRLDKI